MEYYKISGKSFEDALSKAYKQYGEGVTVYSRKNKGRSSKNVEIEFYLSSNNSNNEVGLNNDISDIENTSGVSIIKNILKENDFNDAYIEEALKNLSSSITSDSTIKDIETYLVEYIIKNINIDFDTQVNFPHIVTLLGPTGVGKTTTIAKIASVLTNEIETQDIGIITLDTFRVGAFEQIDYFSKKLGIDCLKAENENKMNEVLKTFSSKKVILIDTLGVSPRNSELYIRLQSVLGVIKEEVRYYIVFSSSMKNDDILKSFTQFSGYSLSTLIVTKLDESESIGNILSICKEKNLKLLYYTDGQLVPNDIHNFTISYIISRLKGFSNIDLSIVYKSQY